MLFEYLIVQLIKILARGFLYPSSCYDRETNQTAFFKHAEWKGIVHSNLGSPAIASPNDFHPRLAKLKSQSCGKYYKFSRAL